MFTLSSLEDCKCVEQKGGLKSKSIVYMPITIQTKLMNELEDVMIIVSLKDAKIASLMVAQQKVSAEGPGA